MANVLAELLIDEISTKLSFMYFLFHDFLLFQYLPLPRYWNAGSWGDGRCSMMRPWALRLDASALGGHGMLAA
jgi:hypothetical protein